MECAAVGVLRVTGCLSPADATRAKRKLTRIVQVLVGLVVEPGGAALEKVAASFAPPTRTVHSP